MERRWWLFYLAWVIALIGFFVSIYFGEVQKFEPCRLCWYQRMALFPIIFLLGIGLYRSDFSQALYACVFALMGLCVATYHALQETLPLLQTSVLCGTSIDCSEQTVLLFGVLSLPALSAIGFASILLLLGIAARLKDGSVT